MNLLLYINRKHIKQQQQKKKKKKKTHTRAIDLNLKLYYRRWLSRIDMSISNITGYFFGQEVQGQTKSYFFCSNDIKKKKKKKKKKSDA